MSSIVTRWVVRRDHAVSETDLDATGAVRAASIEGWIADARDDYLGRCAALQAIVGESGRALRFRLAPLAGAVLPGRPATVTVTAGATELFTQSFTMAFRVRSYGGSDDAVANVTCSVAVEDPESGAVSDLGEAVRDELIALEHAACYPN